MSKRLLIIGAGTFSAEVEELALQNGFDECAFVDDVRPGCIGCTADIPALRAEFDYAVTALGNNANRQKYTELLLQNGYQLPVLAHPTAYVSPDAALAPGCIVRAMAVVSRFAELKTGVIVNVGGLIDHHCVIGEYSHILMGAVVRNQITLPPLTWLASNEVAQ